MSTSIVSEVTNIFTNLVSTALSILGIIGRWFIFQAAGEEGWKAIIPILNTYTYGEIAGERKKTITYIILSVVSIFVLIAFCILVGLMLVAYENGDIDNSPIFPFLIILTILSVIILIALAVVSLILRIAIFKKVDEKLNISYSWIFGWIFIPNITEIILGLTLKNKSE